MLKRLFDLIFTIPGIIILSPVLLVLAIWVHFDSNGPIFFRQERVGRYGVPFRIFKFRTMVKNAAALRDEMERYNELDGPAFKMKNDPRITKVGRFLRRTSLDELPQLYNVLKGDMSLVGPRPLPTYESEKCNEEQLQRLLVKPGITCYWQVCGRNDVSFDEWMSMDLRYIREQSIRTDVRILLQTVKAVLSGRGAY